MSSNTMLPELDVTMGVMEMSPELITQYHSLVHAHFGGLKNGKLMAGMTMESLFELHQKIREAMRLHNIKHNFIDDGLD